MKVMTIAFLIVIFLTSWLAPAQAESWSCRNDLEIKCDAQQCMSASDGFTPMDVRFDDSGSMTICAYSGCWKGLGNILQSDSFTILAGQDLPFSSSPNDKADIAVAVDKSDRIGFVKVNLFAHPLRCK